MNYPRNGKLSAAQSIEASEKRSNLRRRLAAIRTVQVIYMPIVSQLAARQDRRDELNPREDPSHRPEEAPLFLPSSLSAEELRGCTAGLLDMEMRLRIGQMRNALDTLRLHLHIKSRHLTFKARNVRHQQPNTRAREKIDGNEDKLRVAANKYRAAWDARKQVLGLGEWTREWRELKRSDVRCLKEDDEGAIQSEGRRRISWIWQAADSADDDDTMGMNEGEIMSLSIATLLTQER